MVLTGNYSSLLPPCGHQGQAPYVSHLGTINYEACLTQLGTALTVQHPMCDSWSIHMCRSCWCSTMLENCRGRLLLRCDYLYHLSADYASALTMYPAVLQHHAGDC
jgi:hypothetical protein